MVSKTSGRRDVGDNLLADLFLLPLFPLAGWVVLPGAIPSANAKSYVSAAQDWLESFNLGYKRDDKSTHLAANLPFSYKGGLLSFYGSGHEQYAWDIR